MTTTTAKTALFWLIMQLPLLGGAIAGLGGPEATWQRVRSHPFAALAVTVGYELLIFTIAFFKKVWARLEPGAVESVAGTLQTALHTLVSRFRRNYIRQIIHENDNFNTRGLRTQGPFRIKLADVFVELRLGPTAPGQARLDPIAAKQLEGNRPIFDFLRQVANEPGTGLAIVGAPGSGKTTLLQHLALMFARNAQRRHRLRGYLPVLLHLRDHATAIIETPMTLPSLIDRACTRKGLYPPPHWLEKRLANGEVIVLLDGLDEVADATERKAVSLWIDAQISTYPESTFVMTARPMGYRSAPLGRAHVVELLPFSWAQVTLFIRAWYKANEKMRAGGSEDEAGRREASRQADDLLTRLRRASQLTDLTRNPLLLTMIATVHSTRRALPDKRVELYSEICDVELGRWHEAKGLSARLTPAQYRSVLEPLAARMMDARTRELTLKQVIGIIRGPLERVGLPRTEAEAFLMDVQSRSGLFVERETDQWGFSHLTFQEYLAACWWLAGDRNDAATLTHVVTDSWWHEMLRLYAAMGDASDILRACLVHDSVDSMTLASELLEEARELSAALRQEAEHALTECLSSDQLDRFRLAAEVRLRRRLRHFHTIDDTRAIDSEYLTNAEYQLFLNDSSKQGFLQLRKWIDPQFPPGIGQDAVAGVWPSDGDLFCAWLTARTGHKSLYRLPTEKEALDHPGRTNTGMGCWSTIPQGFSLSGLAEPMEANIRQRLMALSKLPMLKNIAVHPELSHILALPVNGNESAAPNRIFVLDRILRDSIALSLGLGLDGLPVNRPIEEAFKYATGGRLSTVDSRKLVKVLALRLTEDDPADLQSFVTREEWRHVVSACRGQLSVLARTAASAGALKELVLIIGRRRELLLQLASSQAEFGSREARYQWRKFLVVLTRFAWQGTHELHDPLNSQRAEIACYIHWLMVILVARDEQKLFCWEGLRIVRDDTERTIATAELAIEPDGRFAPAAHCYVGHTSAHRADQACSCRQAVPFQT